MNSEKMSVDIQAYKSENPKAHLKRKGDYTQKFKKWMRSRVKAGAIDTLWTEPDKIYNEETKRFINKNSRKFFDGRSKKTIKLKKNIMNEYFLKGNRLIKDQVGVINFNTTYRYKKKNTKTGKFYDVIQERTQTHTVTTRKSRALQDAQERIEEERERMEMESGLFVVDYVANKNDEPIINNLQFINYKNKNVSLFDEPMKYNGMVDLDGELKNNEWCKNRGMCVYDFLQYRYGDIKGFKKITKDEKLTEIFKMTDYLSVDREDRYPDPENNGVCVRQLEAWCNVAGVNMYCLDADDQIFHYYKPPKRANREALVFRIKNNHFYPIIDKCRVKTIMERQKDKVISDISEKHKKKEDIINDYYFMEKTATNNKKAIQTEYLIKKIEETNTTPYPLRNITINEGNVQKFKLNDKLYICDTHENNEQILKYCKENNINYQGQTAVGLLKLQLENTYGENWTKVFNSTFNPHVRKLLSYENIKHRTHYGAMVDNIEEVITESKNILCWDVKRCYSKAMYAPISEWLFYDFNDNVEKVEIDLYNPVSRLENGLYYVETKDMSLLHGNNWYSASILNKMIEEKINTRMGQTKILWQLIPRNNKKSVKDAEGIEIDNVEIFTHLIDKITDDTEEYPDLQKLMINSISGLMGKTEGKNLKVDIDSNINRVYEVIQKTCNDKDLYIENIEINDKKYYMYGKTERCFYSDIALPLYMQILDRGNMLLYDMIKDMKGECIYRKTDCAITINSQGKLKKGEAKWGEWRESEMPSYYGYMNKNRDVPTPQEVKPWKYLEYHDSNQAKDIYEKFIKGKGLMLLGRAGTGKTYVAKMIAEATGAKKLAFTNKACLVLNGSTIHKYLCINKNGNIDMKWVRKQNYKYYVVDEISMISGHLWRLLCELKRLTKATFLLVGDYRQLPPVEESDIDYFEHPAIKWLCDSTRCELTEMKRYDIDLWNVSEQVYEDETYNPIELFDKVSIQEMSKSHNISYTNRTRKRINEAVNNYMTKNKKYINIEYTGDKTEPPQSVKAYEGMPLISTKNSKNGEMVNNETFKIKNVNNEQLTAVSQRAEGEHEITIKTEEFHKMFLMGYCVTAHKSQGETIDGKINIYDWDLMDKRLKYTAITRTTKKQNVKIIM